jgi:Bifunctional DNA primase/polymerase, N-terminal
MTATADVHPIQLEPKNAENVAGVWITSNILLHAALYYARGGRPVFPCCPWDGTYLNHKGEPIDAKAPLVTHGFKDASTELQQICTWWAQFPYAMIGSPVAPDELCLDVDPRNGGDRWALVEMAGITELPITRMVLSGRYDGGHHLFFQRPLGQLTDVRIKKIGIDIRVGGKHYTILPPSVHDVTGGIYRWRWDPDAPAAPLPVEVAKLLEPVKVQASAFMSSPRPTGGKLAGIIRKVSQEKEGNRQNIAFWAANRLLEGNYPADAWQELERALRATGASEHDVGTALRDRPDKAVFV